MTANGDGASFGGGENVQELDIVMDTLKNT